MRALVVVMVLSAVVSGACGGGDGDPSACGPVVRERLDPASARHLLPGAPEPAYLSDPPTSGAHTAGRPPTGVLPQPLSRPEQVALLEGGGVVIQYRDLPPAERRRLDRLAGPGVTVAPNPGVPARVVATAWTVKRSCGDVDVDALEEFVDRFGGTAHNH